MAQAPRRARTRSMRTQVRNAIAGVAVLALLLFGIPLAIAADRLITSQALTGLQRDATRGVAAVPDNTLEPGSQVRAPRGTRDIRIGVYDIQGTRVAGLGPAHSALAAGAADGHEHDGHDNGDLSVVVPVMSDTTVAGSVRAAVPLATLRTRSYQAWGLFAGLALIVITVAVLLARRFAIRISQPFERLTAAAQRLGDGRYDVELPHWGITEADAAGDALRDSAREIDAIVRNERAFVRDASHQLRTPLAGVQLSLQQQPPDVATALARARDLETTIADLLSLRGLTGTGSSNPNQIAAEAVRRLSSPERPVVLRSDNSGGNVAITGPALRQSLDVLVDNALRHGRGTVTVTVEPYGDAVLIEVADQGDGFAANARPHTGLRMATNIVERAGGSLLIRRRHPQARVALLLPASAPPHLDATSLDQSSSKR
ncbi:MAG TPA: HAMP domain-containing sensor histidine kinase [Actinoplanes sp.]